jgi:hypothetical protein
MTFQDHALGEVNTKGNSQVRLLCAREQEVTAYRNFETQFQALEQYGRLNLPVHFVLGEFISMVHVHDPCIQWILSHLAN